MSNQPEFIRQQYAFAAHIRDPEHAPAPADIEDRRMAIYRELFYNNVEGFLANTFPVLRTLYKDDDWHELVRDYYAHHLSQTPLFLEIPREFLNWLENEHTSRPVDPDFLYELAHYEWVELALSISEAQLDESRIDREGSFEYSRPWPGISPTVTRYILSAPTIGPWHPANSQPTSWSTVTGKTKSALWKLTRSPSACWN